MTPLFAAIGCRVAGFYGNSGNKVDNWDVAICTVRHRTLQRRSDFVSTHNRLFVKIEKGNSLLNRLIEEKAMHSVGLVVIDEIHMIGDSDR